MLERLNQWTIRKKLLVPLYAVLLVGFFALLYMNKEVTRQISEQTLPLTIELSSIETIIHNQLGTYRAYLTSPSALVEQEITSGWEEFTRHRTLLKDILDTLADASSSQLYELTALDQDVARLRGLGDLLIKTRNSTSQSIQELETVRNDLLALLTQLAAGVRDELTEFPESSEQHREAVEHNFEQLVTLGTIRSLIQDQLSALRELLLTTDPAAMSRFNLTTARTLLHDSIQEYAVTVDHHPHHLPDETLETNSVDDLRVASDKINTLAQSIEQQHSIYIQSLLSFDNDKRQLQELLEAFRKQMMANGTEALSNAQFGMLLAIIAVLVIGLIASWLTTHNVVNRLNALALTAQSLGGGDLNARADASGKDEIADLAVHFNTMAANVQSGIESRSTAEATVSSLNAELEQRIKERTAQLEEAQLDLVRNERLVTLGQLSATISHELRNPLGTLRNLTTMLKTLAANKQPPPERLATLADTTITQCDTIIGDLLEFSRVRPVNLENHAIDDWIATELSNYEHNPSIAITQGERCDLTVAFDTTHLRRALLNLLDNACHALTGSAALGSAPDNGAQTITVFTKSNAQRVELIVEDNGPGMAADVYAKIFEPLFTTKNFGVGLGLPAVKRIMEQHSGGIEVMTVPGSGTRIKLWLPLTPKDSTNE